MEIYRRKKLDMRPCVLALGSFDTIHIGHQKLLVQARQYALEKGIPFGVYMFEKRPAHTLQSAPQKDAYSAMQREKIIQSLGADFIYYEKFDAAFMGKSPEAYVSYLQEYLYAQAVVVGFNYRFGKKAAGDSALLQTLCAQRQMDAFVVPAVCDAEGVVSSTRIRTLLEKGDIAAANALLGRAFALEGSVGKDRGVGHAMGVPTANLVPSANVLLPKDGVYMTIAIVDGDIYPSVTNIGIRPTFGLDKRTVETHLLDFDGDLYGKSIQLAFYAYLRDERNFENVDSLVMQISEDKMRTKWMFSKINTENLKIDLKKQ